MGDEPFSASSMNDLGRLLLYRSRFEEARSFLERALQIYEEKLDSAAGAISIIAENLGLVRLSLGDAAGAVPLLERAANFARSSYGADNLAFAQKLLPLIEAQRASGELWLAILNAELAVKIFEKAFGPTRPEIAIPLSVLSRLYQAQGDFVRARSLIDRVIALQEGSLGTRHPATAVSRITLAQLFEAQGDLQGAQTIYEAAAKLLEEVMGPQVPAAAQAWAGAASTAQGLGQFQKAEGLYRRALTSIETSLGPQHASLAPVLGGLSELYLMQGRFDQAEDTLERALKILGDSTREVRLRALFEIGLATCYAERGKGGHARPLFEEALKQLEIAGGRQSPDLVVGLQRYAQLLLQFSEFESSLAANERALQIIRATSGPSSLQVGLSLVGQGRVYEELGDLPAAEKAYSTAQELWSSNPNAGAFNTASVLQDLGRIDEKMGLLDAAEGKYMRSLQVLEENSGDEHPTRFRGLLHLGGLYINLGSYERAHAELEQSLDLAKLIFGPGSYQQADPLYALGNLYRELGQFQKSHEYLRQSLDILELASGEASRNYPTVLQSLGWLLVDQGRYREARHLFERALHIQQERSGSQRTETALTLLSLSQILRLEEDYVGSQNRLSQAYEIFSRSSSSPRRLQALNLQMPIALLRSMEGDYQAARKLGLRALDEVQAVFGPESLRMAHALKDFGDILHSQGAQDEAIEKYRSALRTLEKVLGPNHPRVGLTLSGLGCALRDRGDDVNARLVIERSLAILTESLEDSHPTVAQTTFTLANLMLRQGDAGPAETLLEEALNAYDSQLGKFHTLLVPALSSLAMVKTWLGQDAEAEVRRLDTIEEKLLSSEIQGGSLMPLCQLGNARAALGDTVGSKRLLGLALKVLQEKNLYRTLYGADVLQARANPSRIEGDLRTARYYLRESMNIRKDVLGSDSVDFGLVIGNLGFLDWHEKKYGRARRKIWRAVNILKAHSSAILPTLSLAEQRSYLGTFIAYPVPYLLSFFGDQPALTKAYPLVFSFKGLLVELMRRQNSLLSEASRNPAVAPYVSRLVDLRTSLAGLEADIKAREGEEIRSKRQLLTEEREEIERNLSRLLGSSNISDPLEGVGLAGLSEILNEGEAIIDIYRYSRLTSDNGDEVYGAILFWKGGTPKLVHLGSATEIDSIFQNWRNVALLPGSDIEAVEFAWGNIRDRLWARLARNLPAKTRWVLLSPDSEAARIPWQLLPSERDNLIIAQIDSVRELVYLRRSKASFDAGSEDLLAVGNIDFGGSGTAGQVFEPLPATRQEIRLVAAEAHAKGISSYTLEGAAANKMEVLSRIKGPEYIHIASHGFFSGDRITPRQKVQVPDLAGQMAERWLDLASSSRNPLAESGICLAGANEIVDPQQPEAKGFLTAQEILGLDLRGCKLVTLSACDTGRGEEDPGQGVLGLRAAFLASGVRSLVMSLWKIPDESTQKLMQEFYKNIWQRGLPLARALMEAQEALRKDPSGEFMHPFHWAGWTLVGEGW